MEQTAITGSVNPTAADFQSVYAWLFWHAPRRYVLAALAILIAAVAGDAWFQGNTKIAVLETALVVVYLALALLQWSVFLPRRAWRAASVHFPAHFEFAPDGVSITSPAFAGRRLWSSYDGYIVTPDFILLVHPKTGFFVVPKRDVEDSRGLDLLRLLAAHLQEKTSLPT